MRRVLVLGVLWLFAACQDEQRMICGTVADCPGDNTCVDIQCVGHICKFSDLPDQSVSPKNVAGDCKSITCDGSGGFYVNVDKTDLPTAGAVCSSARCTDDGMPVVGPAQAGTSCGTDMFCDNTGTCVGCLTPLMCPGTDTECKARTCVDGACGSTNAAAGLVLVNNNPKGDCHQIKCDGNGGTMSVIDDSDVPTNANPCVTKTCSGGSVVTTNKSLGTSCGTGLVCDGAGVCGQCNVPGDCAGAGSDTDCSFHTCNSHVCALVKPTSGTATTTNPPQAAGDCHTIECDGNGGLLTPTPVDDSDTPDDTNSCTNDICTSGTPSHTNVTDGTVCSDTSTTSRCRTGACVTVFDVVRVGDGTTALSTASARVQIEEYYLSDQTLVAPDPLSDGTIENTNPTVMPIAASGSNAACTSAGLSGAGPPLEDFLVRSVDEHSVTLACYNAAPATAAISGTTAAADNRVVAVVNKNLAVDTTTKLSASFSQNSVRSAVTTDGTNIWVSGSEASANGTGGVWYTTLGGSSPVQLTDTPSTVRVLHIAGGQLYGTSGGPVGFAYVFGIGSGEPTAAGQTCTGLPNSPGTTGAGTSPNPVDYAFVTVSGTPTLYITDNRTAANGGGIEKYTFDGTNWTYVTTFDTRTEGMYALTAYVSGTNVIVLAVANTTSANVVQQYTDTGTGTPAAATLLTAPANTGYRGISLAPH